MEDEKELMANNINHMVGSSIEWEKAKSYIDKGIAKSGSIYEVTTCFQDMFWRCGHVCKLVYVVDKDHDSLIIET